MKRTAACIAAERRYEAKRRAARAENVAALKLAREMLRDLEAIIAEERRRSVLASLRLAAKCRQRDVAIPPIPVANIVGVRTVVGYASVRGGDD